ncbi:hypothetical protein C3L33_08483, partial [Rhododendron williamsianum]
LLRIFQDCLVKSLLLVLNWSWFTSQLHVVVALNLCKERFFLVISMFVTCYRMSVEKYPDNRMLGRREVVNGKPGKYVWLTYKEVYDLVIKVGNSIRSCGVEEVSEYLLLNY